jgi:hypothetical protein
MDLTLDNQCPFSQRSYTSTRIPSTKFLPIGRTSAPNSWLYVNFPAGKQIYSGLL